MAGEQRKFWRRRSGGEPLAEAVPAPADSAQLALPAGTELFWRPGLLTNPIAETSIPSPQSGQRLGDEVALWHDCERSALSLQQVSNGGDDTLAPLALQIEAEQFGGSYLSLSVDLPKAALRGLTGSHILRLGIVLRSVCKTPIYGRLNVNHGPNTDTMVREIGADTNAFGQRIAEFDLIDADLNVKRLEKIWLDLIFEQPSGAIIELADLILSRHFRAHF